MIVRVILLFYYKQGNNIKYLMYQTKTGQIVAVYLLDQKLQISQSIIFCVSPKKGKDIRVSKCSVISKLPLHSGLSISLRQTWSEQTKNLQKYSIRSENDCVKYQSFLKLFDNYHYFSRLNKRLIKYFLWGQWDTNMSMAYHKPLFKCQKRQTCCCQTQLSSFWHQFPPAITLQIM